MRLRIRTRIRVNRQEQIRVLAIGERRAVRQRDEFVGAPGEDHFDAVHFLQQLLDAQRDVQHELRFGDAFALRAWVAAAVPWVDDDARDAESELARHRETACGRRGRRLWLCGGLSAAR